MKSIFHETIQTLKQAMKLRIKRNAVLTSNIVNMDTPGYEAKDIPFEKIMQMNLKKTKPRLLATRPSHQISADELHLTRTHKEHFDIIKDIFDGNLIEISTERGTPNNVDLDVEMAKLSLNNLEFQSHVNALIKQFDQLRTAITEGGAR